MGSWFRKWHVVIAVVLGIYLAIPKPTDPIKEFGANYYFPTGSVLKSTEGQSFSLQRPVDLVEEDQHFLFSGPDVRLMKEEGKDKAAKPPALLRVEATAEVRSKIAKGPGFQIKWPFSAFKPNLGQDLAGGTSLRYKISPGDVADAQSRMGEILKGWENAGKLEEGQVSAAFREKALAYMSARDRGSLPDRPGDDLLPSMEEIESLTSASAGFSVDQIKAMRHVREEFARIAKQEKRDLVGPTIELLESRLNSSGMTELNIVKAGDNEIEVKLPALAPAELKRIKSKLSSSGRLEFILLPAKDVFGKDGNKELTAKDTYPGLPEKDAHRFRWYDVDPAVIAASLFEQGLLEYDTVKAAYVESTKRDSDSDPSFSARTWTVVTSLNAVETKFSDKDGAEHKAWVTPEKILVQTSYPDPNDETGESNLQGYPIKGSSLKNAEASSDQNGRPAVSFELKGVGVTVMEAITKRHNEADRDIDAKDHRNLAVAIDGKLYSAPSINAVLSDRIQVSGSFTRAEVKLYVEMLNSGSLSVELTALGEESIGPAEGADNISRGIWSLVIGASLVLLFALVVYRATGLLTMMNLILTIVLILAIMSVFLSTFTLPGIAGLVLTLGMAIDANILINERIREERANGVSPKTAIEQGFKKAFSAIVDGNVTTLITALILTKIGTGAVAGFALTLSIGIICTLYTSLLVYKSTLFFCYEKGIIEDVKGAKLFHGSTFNILKIGKRLTLVNLVLMIAAFSFFVVDAADGSVFGLDFRGGTQTIVQLNENHTREEIKGLFKARAQNEDESEKYPDIQIQERSLLGDEGDGTPGSSRIEIRIPMPEGENLDGEAALRLRQEREADIRHVFADFLVTKGYAFEITRADSVDFEIALSLSEPEGLPSSRRADNWLQVVTNDEFERENNKISSWFPFNGNASMTHAPGENNTQLVTFAAPATTVDLANDQTASNWKKFYDAIARQFENFPKAKELVVGGFPAFSTYDQTARIGAIGNADSRLGTWVGQGDVKATFSLLAPMSLEDFRAVFASVAKNSDNQTIQNIALSEITLNVISIPTGGDATVEASNKFILTMPGQTLFTVEEGSRTRSKSLASDLETFSVKLDALLRDNPDSEATNGITNPIPKSGVIGGRIAGETQSRALLALLIALIAIVIYIGIRFRSAGWGYAAVAALVHDTLFTLGAIAVVDHFAGDTLGFDLKIDLNAIAALLTVIGYSLNDTIVIFDRIREELVDDLKAKRERTMVDVINSAINSTLSRTMLTSISTFVVVLAMVFLGGPAIRTFAWTLLFGLIFGTYSSVFRAGPFLLLFTGRSGDLRETIEREEAAKEEARRAEEEALAEISIDQEYDESDFDDEAGDASDEGSSDDDSEDAGDSSEDSEDKDA